MNGFNDNYKETINDTTLVNGLVTIIGDNHDTTLVNEFNHDNHHKETINDTTLVNEFRADNHTRRQSMILH